MFIVINKNKCFMLSGLSGIGFRELGGLGLKFGELTV